MNIFWLENGAFFFFWVCVVYSQVAMCFSFGPLILVIFALSQTAEMISGNIMYFHVLLGKPAFFSTQNLYPPYTLNGAESVHIEP